MSEEPKPCPFCGGTNILRERQELVEHNEFTGKWTPVVMCAVCGPDWTILEIWNNRPIEDALRAELVTLRGVV